MPVTKIFVGDKLQVHVIKDRDVWLRVGVIMILEVPLLLVILCRLPTILAFWQIVLLLVYSLLPVASYATQPGSGSLGSTLVQQCALSGSSGVWIGVQCAFVAVLLLWLAGFRVCHALSELWFVQGTVPRRGVAQPARGVQRHALHPDRAVPARHRARHSRAARVRFPLLDTLR